MTTCLFQHCIDARQPPPKLSVLGGIGFGFPNTRVDNGTGGTLLRVAAPVLGNSCLPATIQLLTDATIAHEQFDIISTARTAELLFGALVLDESAMDGDLKQATLHAYSHIFSTLDRLGYPILQRVWHFLPAINQHTRGQERYRQFNAGRQQAFLTGMRPVIGNVPPASAVGTAAGALAIAFVAGKRSFVPIESPRQISAYRYPPQYGACSPVFSRAGLMTVCNRQTLLVSGTAAITGHRSVHPGDIVAQTRETMANLRAIVASANQRV